ncbi:MAG: DUF1576 domain-containing protein [Spirochaetes bacterium]|nr:DUF1576 domain-containing protein [Spirochaetota bacterium]
MNTKETALYMIFSIIIMGSILLGFAVQGFDSTIKGFIALQTRPARLIADYTVLGGVGAALMNSGLVAAIGLGLVKLNKVKLSGPTIAAILTMMGFALFGKTPLNCLPIIGGVYIAARIAKKPFAAYILMAMFGTALGPLVTFLVFQSGLTGIHAVLVGVISGLGAGVCLPSIAISMLHLHQGYNLYNIGFSCGFLGLFAASLLSASKLNMDIKVVWNEEPSLALIAFIPAISLFLIAGSFLLDYKKALTDLISLQKLPGRLPTDFVDQGSAEGALLNMGLLGLLGSAYVFLVKGDFNGPVLGGLLTLMGFGAFGKNIRNCWPVVMGVMLSCFIFGKNLAAPGPILAALFGTTLAPLAGQFGVVIGIAAGFVHLVMVERTAAWHGGLDLYNNGFSGGLTASLFVALIEWYRTTRQKIS